MIGRRVLRIILLAAAFVVATLAVGWWGVPIVAVAWGIIDRGARGSGVMSGAAAMLAWAALLGWFALRAPIGRLAETLGGVMGAPGPALVALTLIFPAALAWAAARTAAGVAGVLTRRESSPRRDVPAHQQPG